MLTRAMRVPAVALAALLVLVAFAQLQASAEQPANDAFQRTWARTDQPVASGAVSRTWMWGPAAFTAAMQEDYAEAAGGKRTVQYFDKSRMEMTTDAAVAANSPWHVTNGLLVVELMSGRMQVGNDAFQQRDPAQIHVAGDPSANNGPSYAELAALRSAGATPEGQAITATIDADGHTGASAGLAQYGVTAAHRVQEPGIDHTVASVFWDFMNSSGLVEQNGSLVQDKLFENPFYATGYPITEAYWTTVAVKSSQQQVLLQCFERRCLTYNPANSDGWKVEAGNVGQHYYEWRYGQMPPVVTPPTPSPTPSPTPPPSTGDYTVVIETIHDAGTTNEGVAIWNKTPYESSVNMRGWTLSDDDGHVFAFPDVTLKAAFYVTVRTCTGDDIIRSSWAILHWGICESVSDGVVTLRNAQGQVVATYP